MWWDLSMGRKKNETRARPVFASCAHKKKKYSIKILSLQFCGPIIMHGVASQVTLVVKNLPANAGHVWDAGLIPRLGRSPGGGDGNTLQFSGLENPMDRRAWCVTVHGVAQSRTRLKQLSTMHNNAWIPKHIHAHTLIRTGLQCFNNYCRLHGQKVMFKQHNEIRRACSARTKQPQVNSH